MCLKLMLFYSRFILNPIVRLCHKTSHRIFFLCFIQHWRGRGGGGGGTSLTVIEDVYGTPCDVKENDDFVGCIA